jgi:hypothetical protein
MAADAVTFVEEINIFMHLPAVIGKKGDGVFYIKLQWALKRIFFRLVRANGSLNTASGRSDARALYAAIQSAVSETLLMSCSCINYIVVIKRLFLAVTIAVI